MSFLDDAWGGIKDVVGGLTGGVFDARTEGQYGGVNRDNFMLPGFDSRNNWFGAQMEGKNSLSRLQLQQANDAALAQQRSMAASAAPGNQALAQLSAMQNQGRLSQGLAQQQAMAGIAERDAAARGALANAAQQQQGGIAYEGNRTARAGAALGTPTQGENLLGAAIGGAKAYAMMGHGGVVTQPTRAVVGEAGPEAVIPLAQLPSLLDQMNQRRMGVSDKYMQMPPSQWDRGGSRPAPAPLMARPEELSRARVPITPINGTPPVTIILENGAMGRTRQTARK